MVKISGVKRSIIKINLIIIIVCVIMALVDAVIAPDYFVKAIIKIVLFLVIPIVAIKFDHNLSLRNVFQLKGGMMLVPIILGILVYVFIMGTYFIIGPYFDFSNVTAALSEGYGVNKNNFIWVAIYISLINSLLEEFFFRGFVFFSLKKVYNRRYAYIFSAALFSFYHVAIMSTWFQPLLFILFIIGLFIAGLFFNWLNEKRETIYTSWFVHMCANFGINTVGFILFGIIS